MSSVPQLLHWIEETKIELRSFIFQSDNISNEQLKLIRFKVSGINVWEFRFLSSIEKILVALKAPLSV